MSDSTQVVTVIYKHVNHGQGNTTFRCEACECHFICGICPRFCPHCGIQFKSWLDASIDKLTNPEGRWEKGGVDSVPYEGAGFCGLASPPSAEEIEFRERERNGN